MNFMVMLLILISTTIISSGEPVQKSVKVLTTDEVIIRDGVIYEANQVTPFTGLIRNYHSNGKKSQERHVKNGKRHGVLTVWYETGVKKAEVHFKEGKQHGAEIVWHKNGKKKLESQLKNGILHGVLTRWNEDGTWKSAARYENGVVIETYEFPPSSLGSR